MNKEQFYLSVSLYPPREHCSAPRGNDVPCKNSCFENLRVEWATSFPNFSRRQTKNLLYFHSTQRLAELRYIEMAKIKWLYWWVLQNVWRDINSNPHKGYLWISSNIEEENIFLSLFWEASITLISRQRCYMKTKLQANVLSEYKLKALQQNISKLKYSKIYKRL